MKLISVLIFSVILTLNILIAKANEFKSNEIKLRDQLFADIVLLIEGVDHLKDGLDRLHISLEVLNKRYNSQTDLLKSIQSQLAIDDSEEENDVCQRITGMFNVTLKKYNVLESRLLTKLEEIHDDQTTRLDEISLKQKLNKNCGTQSASSATMSLMTTALAEVSEKIDKFEEKFLKLETLEGKLNLQKTNSEKFEENHLNILQEINEKLAKNQDQFEKMNKELQSLKDLKSDINKVLMNPRPKLPMEIILGLTSSNLTTLK